MAAVEPRDFPLSEEHSAITVAILPFSQISDNPVCSRYARGIPNELAFVLMRTETCRVISLSSIAYFKAQELVCRNASPDPNTPSAGHMQGL